MSIIAVDFDGTLCEHKYPDIGREVPGAFAVLKELQAAGHRLILWTMRCDSPKEGPVLTDAVRWCADRGVTFWGINCNPEQHTWSKSPKQYAHVYIDDAALGCPLVFGKGRPFVDWAAVRVAFDLPTPAGAAKGGERVP